MALKSLRTDTLNRVSDINGLVHIKTVDTGGAVANVNVTDCFNATFNTYKIIIDVIGNTATERNLNIRYLVGTTPNSTANYRQSELGNDSTTVFGSRSTGLTSHRVGRFSNVTKFSQIVEVFFPFQAQRTQIISTQMVAPSGNILGVVHYSAFDLTTSFDGIQFLTSDDLINGKISIFGYATQ